MVPRAGSISDVHVEGFEFAGFWFDHRGLRLYRLRRDQPVEIEPPLPRQTLKVLKVLVERAERWVSRHEIEKLVWEEQGLNVAKENVTTHISKLRECLETKTSRAARTFEIIQTERTSDETSYKLAVPVKLVEHEISSPP